MFFYTGKALTINPNDNPTGFTWSRSWGACHTSEVCIQTCRLKIQPLKYVVLEERRGSTGAPHRTRASPPLEHLPTLKHLLTLEHLTTLKHLPTLEHLLTLEHLTTLKHLPTLEHLTFLEHVHNTGAPNHTGTLLKHFTTLFSTVVGTYCFCHQLNRCML